MTWNLVSSRVDLHGFLNVSAHHVRDSTAYLTSDSSNPTSSIGLTPTILTAPYSSRSASLPPSCPSSSLLSFIPVILTPAPQSQASWFVITGHDFTLDAHNTGGIVGNGQTWWSFYAAGNRTRADGDGRPIALTLADVARGVVRGFRIEAQPFWCNAVARSREVLYEGMLCNATNADERFAGQK